MAVQLQLEQLKCIFWNINIIFFESKLSSTFLKGQKQKGPVQRSFFNTSNITSQLHKFSFSFKNDPIILHFETEI